MVMKIFPSILIVLDLCAAMTYAVGGDYYRVGYWVCAAGITFCATFNH